MLLILARRHKRTAALRPQAKLLRRRGAALRPMRNVLIRAGDAPYAQGVHGTRGKAREPACISVSCRS
jgi:hypothetical protein